MPRVPSVQQQVSPLPLPGVRLGAAPSPESYGSGVGDTTTRLGLELYERELVQADRMAVFEADRKAAELQLEMQGKIEQVRGKNVLGLDEVVKKEWADGLYKIEKGLSNDRQWNTFARLRQHRSLQLADLTQRHAAKQYEAFLDSETDAGVQSALDVIRANPDSPLVFTNETQRIKSLIAGHAVRKGWMGTVTAEMAQQPEFYRGYQERGEEPPMVGQTYFTNDYRQLRNRLVSQAHREVITGLDAQGQDLAVARYFDANKHDLTAADRDAVERIVQEGSTRGEAQRLVRGLLQEGKSERAILQHIDEQVDNPKIVDLAHQLVSRHFREQDAIQKQQQDSRYEQAVAILDGYHQDNPRSSIVPQAILTGEQWGGLSPQAKTAVLAYANHLVPPSDTAERTVRTLIRSGMDYRQTLEAIAADQDHGRISPAVAALARSIADHVFQERDRAERAALIDTVTQATNAIEASVRARPGEALDVPGAVGAETWAQMPLELRRALTEYGNKLDHPDRLNDDRLWLTFLDLDPEQVAKLSRREFDERYWRHFDNHHRTRAEEQWNRYRDALSKPKKDELKVTPTLTFKDQVQNAWALSGLVDPAKEKSKWSTEETKMFVRFEDEAARAVQAYEMTKLEGKRHATPDEVRDIVKGVRDRAVKKVFTEGWFGAKERPLVSLEEDEKGSAFVPVDKIPPDSLADLRRYIESKGKTVTADKLRRAYGQMVLNNRDAFEKIVNE